MVSLVLLVAQINYIAHHMSTNKKTSERHKRRSISMTSKAEITLLLLHYKAMLYRKSEGVLFSETVKSRIPSISFDEKLRFPGRPRTKVRRQGPLGSTRTQACVFLVQIKKQ